MRRFRSQIRTRDILALSGWLFADLLVALALLFFSMSVDAQPAHPVHTPTPTPTMLPRLELKQKRIVISIDANGILGGQPGAINDVKRQMRAQKVLHNRSAGLVIVYGGAPDVSQIDTAVTLAQKIYAILKMLGKEGYVFSRASYYDPLYLLGGDPNTVILDIYLFAR